MGRHSRSLTISDLEALRGQGVTFRLPEVQTHLLGALLDPLVLPEGYLPGGVQQGALAGLVVLWLLAETSLLEGRPLRVVLVLAVLVVQ